MARQRILQGHVLDVLRGLPAASVSCVVTSPPYLGLRSYGTEPQVWAITPEQEACEHEWGDEVIGSAPRNVDHAGKTAGTFRNGAAYLDQPAFKPSGTSCVRCNAWRGELGQEPTLDLFLDHLVAVFREVRRVLHPSGVCFVNISDSYNSSTQFNRHGGMHKADRYGEATVTSWGGHRAMQSGLKPKDLMLVPERLAIRLQADGWYVRSKMPYVKRSAMPESVSDRPTSAVEYVFMLTKQKSYYWDPIAVQRQGQRYQVKAPDGWDTGPGGHGSFHRNGREKGKRTDDERSGRNFRNSDLFFDSLGLILDEAGDPLALDVNPAAFAGAHYSTFPPKLVEPLIKGGSSERGVCPACLAPWTRMVERSGEARQQFYRGANQHGNDNRRMMRNGQFHATSETLGWQSGCTCDAGEPIPATILDPFVGSGTTLLVADRLGRDGIGIDLLAENVSMSEERVRGDAPLFAAVETG